MISGISAVGSTGAADGVAMNSAPPPKASPQASSAPAEDTVQLSSAALTALKAKPAEATETPEQTQAEANAGDPQALAKLASKHLG
jgi:hypothetical protein